MEQCWPRLYPPTRAEAGLGAAVIARLSKAKPVIVARLGADNARIVEQKVLADPRRIGGFPIASGERELSAKEAAELVEWLTNDSDPIYASPKAVKGGTLHEALLSFPLTFRVVGPDSNFSRSPAMDFS